MLSLGHNNIGDVGVKAICEALAPSQIATLRSVTYNSSSSSNSNSGGSISSSSSGSSSNSLVLSGDRRYRSAAVSGKKRGEKFALLIFVTEIWFPVLFLFFWDLQPCDEPYRGRWCAVHC